MNSELLSAIARWTVYAAVGLPFLPSFNFSPEFTTPYVGVPFNVVIACAGGTYASFSWGEKIEPRSRMFKMFVGCLFMGCTMTGLVNAIVVIYTDGFTLIPGVQAGLGALVACLTRFIIPALIERIGPVLDRLLSFLRLKKDA